MVGTKCFGAWLTLVLGFLLVWRTGRAKAVLEASTKSSAKVVQVYADGSLSDGWHDSSEGCLKCNWASTSEARTGSKASFSAVVAAGGSLILASDKHTYPVDSVLDFWAKGSSLTSISLYFGDSANNMYTSDVQFTNVNENVTTIGAPDADGWYHIQIKISKLASIVTKFDRIFLVDVSGVGYRLVLDNISVVPTELAGGFGASDLPVPSILPVSGQDLTAKDAKIGTVSAALRTVQAAYQQPSKLPPVDVVHAWVNGSDPNFTARFKQSTGEPPACNRVQNNNEMLMALLAICKHQPWVNHVYIVVDQQTLDIGFLRPTWQQKVSFVDLTQFVPAEFLPTFNSHTFETFLHRIPGLSDHFIYMNDDMLMSRPIDPASLFVRNKLGFKFKVQLHPSLLGDPTKGNLAWQWPRVNGRQLFQSAFNNAIPKGYDAHSAYLLHRAAMQKTWLLFSRQLQGPLRGNKIRRYTNLTDGGDVHFTSLSQQVGVQLGLQVIGRPILAAGVKHKNLAWYLRTTFYGKAHVVCLQDLTFMNDAGLKLLCNIVADLWCAPVCGDPTQQDRCKKFVSMCSHRPRCSGIVQ